MENGQRVKEPPYARILMILAIIWMMIGLAALAYWLIGFVGKILLFILLGTVLAIGLSSAADWLHSKVPALHRWLIIIVIYLIFLLGIILVGFLVGIPLVAQIKQLIVNYPSLAVAMTKRFVGLQALLSRFGIKALDLSSAASAATDLVKSYGQLLFSGFLSFVLVFSSGVSQFILIIVISFYLLIEQTIITGSITDAFPEKYKEDVKALSHEIKNVISSFIGGQFFLGLLMGVIAAIFAVALGLPYSALIGVFVAVTGLIPLVGSYLGAIPPIIIAYSVDPVKALIFAIFFAAFSQFVSYYLQPKIVGTAIGLNPLTILISLLIGFQLAGFWGAIFSAPIISVGLVIIKYLIGWYNDYIESI